MRRVWVISFVLLVGALVWAISPDEAAVMTGGNTVGFVPGVPLTFMNPAWLVNTEDWILDVHISNMWDLDNTPTSWFDVALVQPYENGFAGFLRFSRTLEGEMGEESFSYYLASYVNPSTSYGLGLEWLRYSEGDATPTDALNVSFGIRGVMREVTAYDIFVKDFTTWSSHGVVDIGQMGVGVEFLLPLTFGLELGVKRSSVWYVGLSGGFDIGGVLYMRGGTSLNLSITDPQKSDLLFGGGMEILFDGFDISMGILTNAYQGTGGSALGIGTAISISAKALW